MGWRRYLLLARQAIVILRELRRVTGQGEYVFPAWNGPPVHDQQDPECCATPAWLLQVRLHVIKPLRAHQCPLWMAPALQGVN